MALLKILLVSFVAQAAVGFFATSMMFIAFLSYMALLNGGFSDMAVVGILIGVGSAALGALGGLFPSLFVGLCVWLIAIKIGWTGGRGRLAACGGVLGFAVWATLGGILWAHLSSEDRTFAVVLLTQLAAGTVSGLIAGLYGWRQQQLLRQDRNA